MIESPLANSDENGGVSLVDGDPDVRHKRQLMLLSEDYAVRCYATCSAMLADVRSRDYSCIVVDVHMPDVDGVVLLRQMRATGWHGRGILLDGITPGSAAMNEAERQGDMVLERTIGDQRLLAAIVASIDSARRQTSRNPVKADGGPR